MTPQDNPPPRQRRSPKGVRRPMTSLRIGDEDLAEIDRRATEAGVSRTQYIIDRALGRVPGTELENQLDELRDRIEALEATRRRSRKT